jgi:hypothetical protein
MSTPGEEKKLVPIIWEAQGHCRLRKWETDAKPAPPAWNQNATRYLSEINYDCTDPKSQLTPSPELGFETADGSIDVQGRDSTDRDRSVVPGDLRLRTDRSDSQRAIRGHMFFNVS